MPELPEVERVRRSLVPRVVGRRVESVRVLRREAVATERDPPGGFSRARGERKPARLLTRELLAGDEVARIDRLGKQLTLEGASGRVVCVHLGMTGHLEWVQASPDGDTPRAHMHVAWRLDDGSRVEFRDARRFGGVWTFASRERLVEQRWRELGPDALGATGAALHEGLKGSKRPIKAALLDQHVLAGVGNIYADEALFRAGIRPGRAAGRLTRPMWERLAAAIREVLGEAIEAGGSTIRDYADGEGRSGGFQRRFAVYGRGGRDCPRCGSALRSSVVGQRTTVYCARCQR